MINKILNICLAGLSMTVAVLFCSACSADEGILSEQETSVVTFDASLLEDYITKGQVPLETATLFTMGIFAGYEEDDETFGPSSIANDFINNVRYTRSFIYEPFAGEDVCYWPFSGKLSFFAYAPYVSDQFLQFDPDYVSGYPVMRYTPTTDVTEQPDFCIATPVLDQHKTESPIPLHYNHTLSQILFAANYQGSIPAISSTLYIKVDNIEICNVIGSKSLIMSSGTPCFVWQDDSECPDEDRTDYALDRFPDYQLADVALKKVTTPATDNYVDITAANGRLYLLPQSMNYGQVYLKVTYSYYEMVGTAETLRSSVTTTCNLPEVTWLPTHCYRYKFTINLATNSLMTPTVDVIPWSDVNNTQSNPIHIE